MSAPARGADELAEFAAELTFESIPVDVVSAAKRCLMDTVGCGVFGAELEWSQILRRTLLKYDGAGAVPVWGCASGVRPDLGALINGAQVHGYEFDDLHKRAILHPGGVTVPALAALVHSSEDAFSGTDFLTALVTGYETCIRVGLAIGPALLRRGWHNNGVLGTFGAAAGAGRLIGLSAPQMSHALGMAASQSSGLMAAQFGSDVKRMHAGRAAQSGLYSAILAADGYLGIEGVFEPGYGRFPDTFADSYDQRHLVSGLGDTWELRRVGIKPYPSCGSSHTSIDAALVLRSDHAIDWPDIEEVTVQVSSSSKEHVGWPYQASTVTAAQMNLSYAIACAFIYGRVGPDQYQPQVLRSSDVRQLADRVVVQANPDIDGRGPEFRHAIRMQLRMSDGRRLDRGVDHARGSEHHPLAGAEVTDKFTSLVIPVLGRTRADELHAGISRLDSAADVRPLFEATVRAHD